jgi:hypothetical protein
MGGKLAGQSEVGKQSTFDVGCATALRPQSPARDASPAHKTEAGDLISTQLAGSGTFTPVGVVGNIRKSPPA